MRMLRRAARAVLVVAVAASVTGVAGVDVGHAGTGPLAYVVYEEGTTSTCTFGRLDLSTGALTAIGTPGDEPCVSTTTFGPDGTLYGLVGDLDDVDLVRIDLTTGALTTVGPVAVEVLLPAGGLAFDRSGALWLYIQSQSADCADFSCLYRIDPVNAATTFVGGGGNETIVNGLAGQCDDRVLTAHGIPPQQPQALASVDTATGGLTDLGPLDSSYVVDDFATEADGALWALAVPNVGTGTQIFRVDPAGPTVTAGPLLDEGRSPLAFAIEPLSCPPAPQPVLVVAAPSFTG